MSPPTEVCQVAGEPRIGDQLVMSSDASSTGAGIRLSPCAGHMGGHMRRGALLFPGELLPPSRPTLLHLLTYPRCHERRNRAGFRVAQTSPCPLIASIRRNQYQDQSQCIVQDTTSTAYRTTSLPLVVTQVMTSASHLLRSNDAGIPRQASIKEQGDSTPG